MSKSPDPIGFRILVCHRCPSGLRKGNLCTAVQHPISECAAKGCPAGHFDAGEIAYLPIGDCVAFITKITGISALARLYERMTGNDCGCHGPGKRQDWLNHAVPNPFK